MCKFNIKTPSYSVFILLFFSSVFHTQLIRIITLTLSTLFKDNWNIKNNQNCSNNNSSNTEENNKIIQNTKVWTIK